MTSDRVLAKTASSSRPSVYAAVAGWLLLILGLANAALAILSLVSDALNLELGSAIALLVTGGVTALLGLQVRRGARRAIIVALILFGLLLVVQLADLAAGGAGEGSVVRLLILLALSSTLALALMRSAR